MDEGDGIYILDEPGYRLRSWDTIPMQGFGGWLTFRIVFIINVIDYLVVRPRGRGFGYVRNPSKTWIMSPTDQFQ